MVEDLPHIWHALLNTSSNPLVDRKVFREFCAQQKSFHQLDMVIGLVIAVAGVIFFGIFAFLGFLLCCAGALMTLRNREFYVIFSNLEFMLDMTDRALTPPFVKSCSVEGFLDAIYKGTWVAGGLYRPWSVEVMNKALSSMPPPGIKRC